MVRVAFAFLLISALSPGAAELSNESMRRKKITVDLCGRIVEEYTRYLAGLAQPKNLVSLEREFNRCANVFDEYEMLKP